MMSEHPNTFPAGGSGIDCRALLEFVSEIVIVIDEAGTIQFLNPSFETVLGYPISEQIGMPVWPLVHPDDLGLLSQGLARRLRGEGDPARVLEIRGRHQDGSWLILEVRSRGLQLDTDSPLAVVTARDVTEQARLKDQLRQALKMEAVGLLASGVAHDFNNLLTGIRGYADLLLRDLTLEDQWRHDIEEIRKAAYRATGLTRQLLAFSRRQELEPQILDPGEVIADLEKMLQRLIYENIEVRTTMPRDTGWIAADRNQLEQVVINLAVNARDAMPDGGVLAIDVDELELDEEMAHEYPPLEPGHYVRIRVSDTGSGMDEETRRHIFQPFFTTKEPGKGTGLGLSTVQALARKSGGVVSVESTPGVGSTFQVILPRVQTEVVVKPAAEQPVEFGGPASETVLLVEDEPVVRNLVHRVLQLKGYRVLAASDGDEARRIAERYPEEIHLLISDVVMPRLGGAELARLLLRTRPCMRVLLISGHAAEEMLNGEIDGSRIAFFEKPFTPDSLIQKVRELLSSDRGH
jgi:PAS domain S-box-containing protein